MTKERPLNSLGSAYRWSYNNTVILLYSVSVCFYLCYKGVCIAVVVADVYSRLLFVQIDELAETSDRLTLRVVTEILVRLLTTHAISDELIEYSITKLLTLVSAVLHTPQV